jgi:mannose-1-phosphate guanylyltransferase
MLHAIIMAGGSGTRFWPKSRRNRPKQLLNLFGDRSMLQATADRIAPLAPPSQMMVITGADQADAVRAQLPDVPPGNVVGEPCPRDTAPCVGLAALLVMRGDPEGVMIVMPADHVIEPADTFRQTVAAAVAEVERDPSTFVVFGVKPTRPEIGYGYIERAEKLGEPSGIAMHRVERFKEKPDRATAEQFLAAGRFVWNAGIFIWKARTVLDALRRFQPEIADRLDRIQQALGSPDESRVIAEEFPQMKKMPIDKAVMEHYENVRVLEVTYDWSDVGDWRSLAELLPRDDHGNGTQGPAHLVGASNALVIADEGRPIVVLGLDDVVVVQSGGATLVARRSDLDRLKGVVEGLGGAGLGELL